MAEKRKLRAGILTGGGDCAGLNPAVKWVVKGLLDEHLGAEYNREFEVFGLLRGWASLANVDFEKGINDTEYVMPLNEKVVRKWDRYGGTMLGSSRTNPLKSKETLKRVCDAVKALELDVVVGIGGEDTLGGAHGLMLEGVPVCCIPKTIDKDLCATDYTLGFSTAVEVIRQEIARIRTTAGSHHRVFIVEIMGRHAGHLCLHGGIAGNACMILLPEVDFDMEKVGAILKQRRENGARYDIVCVAEGAKPTHRKEQLQDKELDEFGHVRLGGIAEWMGKELKKQGFTEVRHVILSHLQRGGEPQAFDVRIGRAYGLACAELIMQEKFGRMVALRDGMITSVPMTDAIRKDENGHTILNLVNLELEYDMERYIARRKTLNTKFF